MNTLTIAARLTVALSALLCLPAWAAGNLPDPRLTPGAIDPAVTQQNIDQTICRRGYTKTARPPAFYTNRLKMLQIRQYQYSN